MQTHGLCMDHLQAKLIYHIHKQKYKECLPILAAELQISSEILSENEDPMSGSSIASWRFSSLHHLSILRLTLLRTANAFSGNWPMADSPESIKASARCLTASETSATSALVGVGYSIMDSSNWEATMTGLLSCLHTWTILCWAEGTCSSGIWAPRSPLATIAPSEAWMISSKFFSESILSIFAMTEMSLHYHIEN